MSSRSKPVGANSVVRRIVRRMGYDVIRFPGTFADTRARALLSAAAVLDVGANTGQFGEEVRALGCRKPIISFEPLSSALPILRSNARTDGNWTVKGVALGAEKGAAVIHIAGNSVSSSLLAMAPKHLAAAPYSRIAGEESVTVSTLDSEMIDYEGIGPLYLKLDTQGFELQVLAGATETLPMVRWIQSEVSFDLLYHGQADWLDLCRFVQDRGFVVQHLQRGFAKPDGGLLQADLLFIRSG